MAITAAQVEANGWVLAITHNRGLGSFASYALTPDAMPALTLAAQHPGFDASGGIAVANAAKARSFTGTKPLRQAAVVSNGGVLSAKAIDETDNGGGSVTVRIALSNWVYATDTALTLTALAGWRTGEVASTVAVTNNSTVACPAPIHRWADVPYRLQRGSFDVEMLVFGFFPQANQPVAAVKFTVTDGTTVKTFWSSALSTSTQFGDRLRCYRVTVDPSTATALTAGLLRVDAEVYPWIGAMRPTDVAGAKSMAALSTDGFLGKAQAPFVTAWDPTGSHYPFRCIFVDPSNAGAIVFANAGSTTIATGASDAAALLAARAGAVAHDVATAAEAIRLAGVALAASNGQAGGPRALDAVRVVLAAGVHATGLGINGAGYYTTATETWFRVEGDPANANPRQNVIVRTTSAGGPAFGELSNNGRWALSNCSVELGYVLNLWTRYAWFDNVEFRNAAAFGLTGGVSPLGGSVAPAGYLGLHVTRSRIWKSGQTFDQNFGGRAKIVRNAEHRRAAQAPVSVKNRVISEAEDNSFTGPQGSTIAGALVNCTDPASVYDSILGYCDLRACQERGWNGGYVPSAYTGGRAGADVIKRQVVFGNIMERISASVDPTFSTGESQLADIAENILEANTIVGQRVNFYYNNPGIGASVAATDAAANSPAGNSTVVNVRVAGNIFAAHYSKHERFNDPAVASQRAAASDPRTHGVRPGLTGLYAALYAVGQRDNVNLYQDYVSANGVLEAFQLEYEGLNCRFDNAPIDPKYTSDKSRWQLGVDYASTATGVGDYTPLAGAPALARVASGNSDRDILNAPRASAYAAGAIEAVAAVVVGLVPAAVRHSSLVSSPAVSWTSLARGASALLATRSFAAGVAWAAAASPGRSSLAMLTGPARATWSTRLTSVHTAVALRSTAASLAPTGLAGTLTAAHGALAMRAGAAALSASGTVPPTSLRPDGTIHVLRDAFSLNLQPGGNDGASIRTIAVPSDFRVHSITLS